MNGSLRAFLTAFLVTVYLLLILFGLLFLCELGVQKTEVPNLYTELKQVAKGMAAQIRELFSLQVSADYGQKGAQPFIIQWYDRLCHIWEDFSVMG